MQIHYAPALSATDRICPCDPTSLLVGSFAQYVEIKTRLTIYNQQNYFVCARKKKDARFIVYSLNIAHYSRV